jgi:hypothetical protein
MLRRQYEFSKHAVDQSIIRDISVAEIEEAISGRSEVVEDYQEDKYGPSCLILGFTDAGRPLHIQCSYPTRPLIKIITLYQPDAELWTDYRIRRPTYVNADNIEKLYHSIAPPTLCAHHSFCITMRSMISKKMGCLRCLRYSTTCVQTLPGSSSGGVVSVDVIPACLRQEPMG